MAINIARPKGRSIRNLRMVWSFATKYPGHLVMAIGCVATMLVLAPKLAGLMLIGIPVVLAPMLFLGRRVRAISTRNQDRIAAVGTVTTEVLGAMKIVQAFNQQRRETNRFAH